jgi:hypothetical protein
MRTFGHRYVCDLCRSSWWVYSADMPMARLSQIDTPTVVQAAPLMAWQACQKKLQPQQPMQMTWHTIEGTKTKQSVCSSTI